MTLRYVDHNGNATETYPLNPNGSPQGITGLTTPDGRFSIMMPHPGARVPYRAELLVSARWARERRMAAHVPECAEVGRVAVSLLEMKRRAVGRLLT